MTGSNYLWIVSWLSFIPLMSGTVVGQTAVSGDLSVHHSVTVQVSNVTDCDGSTLNATFGAEATVECSADANSTYLSAVHVLDSVASGSSDLSQSYLSKRVGLESTVTTSSSSVSGRVIVNPVNIDNQQVSGSSTVSADASRQRAVSSDISCGSSVNVGLEKEVSPEVAVECASICDANLNATYSFVSSAQCSSVVSGNITVNPVVLEGSVQTASTADASVSTDYAASVTVAGVTSVSASAEALRLVEAWVVSDQCRSQVSADLNKQGAQWSESVPNSVVTGYLNAVWDLHGTMTTAPLSNTKLTVYLSAVFETSVSVLQPRSQLTVWLGRNRGVDTQVSCATVSVVGDITMNPKWFTDLQCNGATSGSADMYANRQVVSETGGATQISADINKAGACWSVVNAAAAVEGYLNRWGACWSTVQPGSAASAGLSAAWACSSDISASTAVDAEAWRMRNLYGVSDAGGSAVVGDITVNLTPITDAVVEYSGSSVSGSIGIAYAVDGSSLASSAVSGEAFRKRSLESTSTAGSQVSADTNANWALYAHHVLVTSTWQHLSRRFYTEGDLVPCQTVLSAHLSAIRPLFGESTFSVTVVDATAYRMRNVVPDLVYGYSGVTGHVVLNAVPIDGTSDGGRSDVTGDVRYIRSLDADAVSGSTLATVDMARQVACWSDPVCTSQVDVTLNARFSCWSDIAFSSTLDTSLNADRAIPADAVAGSTYIDATVNRNAAMFADSTASSAVSGKILVNVVEIDASSIGDTALSGVLNRYAAVEGQANGSSTLQVDAYRLRNVDASPGGLSQVSGDTCANYAVWSAVSDGASVSAELRTFRSLTAQSDGVSAIGAMLGVARAVSADSAGYTNVEGNPTVQRPLFGYCPTETTVTAVLVKNIRELWAVSDGNSSSVSAELQRLLQFIAVIQSGTQGTADINAWFALWSNLYPSSSLPTQFNAEFALSSTINLSRSLVSPSLSVLHVLGGASGGDSEAFGSIAVMFAVSASTDECRSSVSAELTLNAKELKAQVVGHSQVSADLQKLRVLHTLLSCASSVDCTLSAEYALTISVDCGCAVLSALNADRACAVSATSSSQVSGRAEKIRSITALSIGRTTLYSQLSMTVYPASQIYTFSNAAASLSQEKSLHTVVYSRSLVSATLGLRGVLFGGDPFAQFTSTGGRHLVALVKDTPSISLPDWARVDRATYSLLSALVESVTLGVSPDLVSELTPLSMSAYHHSAVWFASVAQEPESVMYRPGGSFGWDTQIRRAESMYDLVHTPVPKWYWQDGRLYVSRLANGMEQVNVSGDRFVLARPVRIDRRFPVYLVWTRPRGDLFYLLDERQLRFTSDYLVSIEPRFGYIIGLDSFTSLHVGAKFDVYVVTGKAHPWLVFQSSSGGDSLPACQPTIINLTNHGFVSIQVHYDNIVLDKARSERIYRNAEGSLSACGGLRGQLVGVFVGNTPPSVVPRAISPGDYNPDIGQVFPVEPGARYVVPAGATRLVLGILHDGSYTAGDGLMMVSVTEYDEDGSISVLYTDPHELSTERSLLVDGKRVSATAVNTETNRFYRWYRLFGGALPFTGWNGFDIAPYLQIVGVNAPVMPGIKPNVYAWDGQSAITVQGYRVEVPGLPSDVSVRFRMQGNHLPYLVDGRMLVNGVWSESADVGDEVHARVVLWSKSSPAPGVITVTPTGNMQPMRSDYMVVSLPYEIQSAGVSLAPVGNSESAVFAWSDDVS